MKKEKLYTVMEIASNNYLPCNVMKVKKGGGDCSTLAQFELFGIYDGAALALDCAGTKWFLRENGRAWIVVPR
jgi:hypothetical protein